ncbi:MAG: 50S ribosomal protein L18 [Candidatus Nealsonbacteria bacterium RBG_13_36_15]|uniref:Large ribosomal subunit protein uL18 n=1 Tax=Candidatus Nealsonbacteria bacterium RBG_13_36_15 TaxID=1801660 RepID=A0A1G2DXN4_9BACT|nr:MAG: 50S ribosomal protein L18 [Candidatus Nealsonbacteria bacterium RBG_13_36_15]
MNVLKKREKRHRRHRRLRAKVRGTAEVPRFCVFRSNKHIYAQLINDEKGNILVSANDAGLKQKPRVKKISSVKATEDKKGKTKLGKIAIAYEVGKLIAEMALKKKIEKVVFDRGGFDYHGRIKSLADGAREGGLKF